MAKPIVAIDMKIENLGSVRAAFEAMKPSRQRAAYRSAAGKSATRVRKTARSLIPKGLGLTPTGKKRIHLRDALVKNVKTIGKGKGATVSAIVGADYKKISTIHLVNNPVKPHVISTTKRTLSDLNNAAEGDKKRATAFTSKVKHPGFKGLGFLQQSLTVNTPAIVGFYEDAIRKSVAKAAAKK